MKTKILTVKDSPSQSKTFNTYEEFEGDNKVFLKEATLLNFISGDGIVNTVYQSKVNGAWYANQLNIPEDQIGVCELKALDYKVINSLGESQDWIVIEESVEGKEGLGQYDLYGEVDSQVMYNYYGDELVQSKYLNYTEYSIPEEVNFSTGIDPTIPVVTSPTNPPRDIGDSLIKVDTNEYIIATGNKDLTNWKVL